MRQEDINDMMKTPAEGYWLRHKPQPCKIYCPECGEAYIGDGVKPCADCRRVNDAPGNAQQQDQADSAGKPHSLS